MVYDAAAYCDIEIENAWREWGYCGRHNTNISNCVLVYYRWAQKLMFANRSE